MMADEERETPPIRKRPRRKPRPPVRRHALEKVIYGEPTGRFLLVEYDRVDPPPEKLDNLEKIGTMRDLIRGIGRGRNLVALADQLNIPHPTFNGYAYKSNLRPLLEPGMWRELVRLYFTPPEPDEKLRRNQKRD